MNMSVIMDYAHMKTMCVMVTMIVKTTVMNIHHSVVYMNTQCLHTCMNLGKKHSQVWSRFS